MHARGISKPFTFLTTHGFTHHTASNLMSGKNRAFNLDHVERLCAILYCTPNDILRGEPAADNTLPADHPLHTIEGARIDEDFMKKLRTMPLDELRKVAEAVNAAGKG